MGIAGAVNPELHPGDVVIPERWYYHDESVYINPSPENPDEYVLPDYYKNFLSEQPERRAKDLHTPNYKNFGMIHPDDVLIIKDGMDAPEATAYFSATPRLLEASREAMKDFDAGQFVDGRDLQMKVGGNGVYRIGLRRQPRISQMAPRRVHCRSHRDGVGCSRASLHHQRNRLDHYPRRKRLRRRPRRQERREPLRCRRFASRRCRPLRSHG